MAKAPKNKASVAQASPLDDETYTVLSPLRHDGQRYKPGDLVLLTEEEAAVLIGMGVVAPAPSPAAPPPPDKEPDATAVAASASSTTA